MRFGITALEFRPILDQIVVDGVPDFSRFDITNLVRLALQIQHIKVIEVTADIEHVVPGSLTEQSIEKMVHLKEELKHAYTVHLPIWSLELSTFNEYARKAAVECTVKSIKLVEPLQPEVYVLHATGALAAEFSRLKFPRSMVQLICGYMASYAAKSIEEILAKTEIDPRKVAIENQEFPFQIARDLVDQYGTNICFDTGHLLTRYSGDESVLEFYKQHRDRIVEIHLHDGSYEKLGDDLVHKDHMALGRGAMPVREFLRELVNDKFNGPVVFELKAAEAKESLERIRAVVPEALKR